MIFTRRFGALRAFTFPSSSTVIDVEEYEAQRKEEIRRHRAAKGSPTAHHRRWHLRARDTHGHA